MPFKTSLTILKIEIVVYFWHPCISEKVSSTTISQTGIFLKIQWKDHIQLVHKKNLTFSFTFTLSITETIRNRSICQICLKLAIWKFHRKSKEKVLLKIDSK